MRNLKICQALCFCLWILADSAGAVDVVKEPATEAEKPATPAEAKAPSPPAPRPVDLTPAEDFRNGLRYEDAVKQLGCAGEVAQRATMEKATYRWSDERGSSFIARFEDGNLIYKSSFRQGSRTPSGQKPLLSKAACEALEMGAPLKEALKLEPQGNRVSASTVEVVEYVWRNEAGEIFKGRFEDGSLRQLQGRDTAARARAKLAERKATLAETKQVEAGGSKSNPAVRIVSTPAAPKPEDAAPTPVRVEVSAEEQPADVPAEQQGPPVEEATEKDASDQTPGDEQPEDVPPEEELLAQDESWDEPPVEEAPIAEEEAEEQPYEVVYEPEPAPAPRVHIAGSSRRAREAENDQGRERRARLPEYYHSLRRGRSEILVRNTARTQVSLGLRLGDEGRDATVGPNGATSFFVDRGVYTLYFIYRDDPYTLHQGPSINLDGFRLPDADVTLHDGTYTIQVLEGRSSGRR